LVFGGIEMTDLLAKAFAEASKLPGQEQDTLAKWILEELASERQWEKALLESVDALSQLADEALAEHHAGRTQVLDPEKL
jgi:hypothetical protein